MEFIHIEITNLDREFNLKQKEYYLYFPMTPLICFFHSSLQGTITVEKWILTSLHSLFCSHTKRNTHIPTDNTNTIFCSYSLQNTLEIIRIIVSHWAQIEYDAELLHDATQKSGILWCFWIILSSLHFASNSSFVCIMWWWYMASVFLQRMIT